MENLENILILILLLAIGYFYYKNNEEHFSVNFLPYYPITTEVNPKYNNYTNSIEDKRLDVLKNALESVKKDLNKGNTNYREFNEINLPVIKKSEFKNDKLNVIIDYLLPPINIKLGDSYTLIVDDIKDKVEYETENETKINLKLICQFKIKTLDKSTYSKPDHIGNIKENQLIIFVEIVTTKNPSENYINYIQIGGLTGGNFLPGKNYYDNNSNFMVSDIEASEIIDKKLKLNSDEVENYNNIIEEDEDENEVNNNITIDESFDENLINTEEAESFFNL